MLPRMGDSGSGSDICMRTFSPAIHQTWMCCAYLSFLFQHQSRIYYIYLRSYSFCTSSCLKMNTPQCEDRIPLSFLSSFRWCDRRGTDTSLCYDSWCGAGVEFQVGQGSNLLILISLYRQALESPQFLICGWGPSFPSNSTCKNVGIKKWTELPWKGASLECGSYSGM